MEQLWNCCFRKDEDFWLEHTFTFNFIEGARVHFSKGMQVYDMVMCALLIVGFVIRIGVNLAPGEWGHLSVADPEEMLDVADLTLSAGGCMSILRAMFLFDLSDTLGPLWVAIKRMSTDIKNILVLLVIIIGAFYVAFLGMLHNENLEHFAGDDDWLSSPWLAFRGLAFSLFDLNGDGTGVNFGGAARQLFAEHFFRSNALHCTATARMLIPAECSAIS